MTGLFILAIGVFIYFVISSSFDSSKSINKPTLQSVEAVFKMPNTYTDTAAESFKLDSLQKQTSKIAQISKRTWKNTLVSAQEFKKEYINLKKKADSIILATDKPTDYDFISNK